MTQITFMQQDVLQNMVNGRNKSRQIRAIKAKQKSKRVSFNDAGISKLPRYPGVYKINYYGQTSYIGSTKNLQRRLKEHMRNGNDGTSVSYKRTVTRQQAYNLERNSIGKSCPPTNKMKPDRCKGLLERIFG